MKSPKEKKRKKKFIFLLTFLFIRALLKIFQFLFLWNSREHNNKKQKDKSSFFTNLLLCDKMFSYLCLSRNFILFWIEFLYFSFFWFFSRFCPVFSFCLKNAFLSFILLPLVWAGNSFYFSRSSSLYQKWLLFSFIFFYHFSFSRFFMVSFLHGL